MARRLTRRLNEICLGIVCCVQAAGASARRAREDEGGQGTTEYAILVGVIVVIAILAVVLFRDKLQELWNSIVNGINSL